MESDDKVEKTEKTDKTDKNKDKKKVEAPKDSGGITLDAFLSNSPKTKALGNVREAGFRAWCKRKDLKVPYRQSESDWTALWDKFCKAKPD